MNISKLFAHCEYDERPLLVRVTTADGPYLEIEGTIGIFMTREQLQQLADAIYAAIAPSADPDARESAARDTNHEN